MTPLEIIVGAVVSVIASYLAYRQYKLTQQLDERKENNTKEREFIEDLIGRVEKLETRQDVLQDRVSATAEKAEQDRRTLIAEYEQRTELLRKEMRRAIDDANLEMATWRDKYFTLINDYQKLKLEYATLEVKFTALEKEYHELKRLYDQKASVTVNIESNKSNGTAN
jgi:chromosome segregation ATPase